MAGLMAAMDMCKLQSFSTSTVYSSISPFHSNFSTRPCRQNIVSWKRHQYAIFPKPISVCRISAAGCRGLTKGLMVTCKASSLGESEFEEKVVKSELPVLVDFVADWCGPCKLVAPTIDWASEVPSLSLV